MMTKKIKDHKDIWLVNTDINDRWEKGVDHHPKSIELFEALEEIDWEYGGDSFCWKAGGDGDNGEQLMYLLDIYFDLKDVENKNNDQERSAS